jgi:hypothetical protein
MNLTAVRDVSLAVTAAHVFVYLVPEAQEEAAEFGVTERRPAYFAFRAAALGPVPWQIVHATFYNFSPRAVQSMAGVWEAAPPHQWQQARFGVVARAMRRVGLDLTAAQIAEARALIDPVVAGAEFSGKPQAAANAAVDLPADPLSALWQQITIVREWRGDAHVTVLADNRLGPCDCNVIHSATGRLPAGLARATRGWDDREWSAASARLAARGWLTVEGVATETGVAAREKIEDETDEHCAELWAPIGDDGARRLGALIAPINTAFAAAGTYDQLR